MSNTFKGGFLRDDSGALVLSAGTGGSILSGAGSPATSLGSEGGWYVDLTNDILYGPKAGVNWGQGRYIGGEKVSIAGGLRGENVPSNDPAIWANATRLLFHDRAYAVRWQPKRAWAITLAEWIVTGGANADDHCEVALYSGADGSRLVTSGDLAGKLNGSAGLRSNALAYTVDPAQVYYVVFRNGPTVGTNAATLAARAWSDVSQANLFGTTLGTIIAFMWDLTAGAALPTTIPASGTWNLTNGNWPEITLREV